MACHAKTLTLREAAIEVLTAHRPMMVRQFCYQIIVSIGEMREDGHPSGPQQPRVPVCRQVGRPCTPGVD